MGMRFQNVLLEKGKHAAVSKVRTRPSQEYFWIGSTALYPVYCLR